MIVAQATRNPFELERLRLQRNIDRVRLHEDSVGAEEAERFDLVKEGLRRLLAAGASSASEAEELISRIRRIAMSGTRIEVETIKVWPEHEPKARPASEFFVNERIDLLVREAETFRNDYRDKERRMVFHALRKPIPFIGQVAEKSMDEQEERANEVSTQRYCGLMLALIIVGCGVVATMVISRQNRQTH